MADQANTATTGVLGRLPPWPRSALNNSVISAEQAYRKRKGLPELTEEDMAALRAGEPMPWERGDASPSTVPAGAPAQPAATPAVEPPATQAAPAVSPAPAAASTGISDEVKELLTKGLKWSRSSIAAEQARRKRKDLPPFSDAEVAALLGEEAAAPAPPAATPAAPASQPAAAKSAAAPAKPAAMPATSQVAREGTATRYVGTPAVGTSKAAAAGGVPATGPADTPVSRMRRRLVWTAVAAFLTAWLVAFFRFFLPRTLFEPSTSFKIGYPSDYALGVDTKWQQKYRIWVDRTPDRLFVIYARCTHLGCTPDWKPSENKFKCPCHGSGYDSEGVNFEGPAPRPMDRAHVDLAPDGQVQVNVAKLYAWPKGQPSQFSDPGAYIPV